jgi:hypothetical protein
LTVIWAFFWFFFSGTTTFSNLNDISFTSSWVQVSGVRIDRAET